LFKALVLATWHDFSDVRLAEALDDRASFCRFCGIAAHEPTPERTAFVRFRAEQVRCGLDRALFRCYGLRRGAGGGSPRPVCKSGWRRCIRSLRLVGLPAPECE
jgi:hypothetical protein